jgi:hypothetical protein
MEINFTWLCWGLLTSIALNAWFLAVTIPRKNKVISFWQAKADTWKKAFHSIYDVITKQPKANG